MKKEIRIPFARPDITKEDIFAVIQFMLSGNPKITDGENCREFEREFLKFIGTNFADSNALTVSSCTAALHLACMTIGLGPGDEVIVPAMGHVAAAHAVEITGATPVFVDCDIKGNVDSHDYGCLINSRTKAIIVLHYLGIGTEVNIMRMKEEYGVYVIEDCALALGSKYDGTNGQYHVGTLSDFACFSFYPTKHITTGDGGMLVFNGRGNHDMKNRAKELAQFGKVGESTDYDINSCGLNYRMTEIQACLGRSQLFRLHTYLKRREDNLRLFEGFMNEDRFACAKERLELHKAICGSYCISIIPSRRKDRRCRDKIRENLLDKGVETSIYYPRPVPAFLYYRKKYGYKKIWFPHAEEIAYNSFAIPIGPHVTANDMEYMFECFDEVAKEVYHA